MRKQLSVIIICKNAAADIRDAVESVLPISDDIIIYDNGSTDDTLSILKEYPVRVINGNWEGFGKTRKAATKHAAYDWIFTIDTDEKVDEEMVQSILSASIEDDMIAYKVRLRNFISHVEIKNGGWGKDYRIRMFNRKIVNWDDAYVHEKLQLPVGMKVRKLKGSILHKTAQSFEEYNQKLERYAVMTGDKYFEKGKKATAIKYYASPAYTFIKNYIFRLGFLDGKAGLTLAKASAYYTKLKYRHLKERNRQR